jgi:hypothetical protein
LTEKAAECKENSVSAGSSGLSGIAATTSDCLQFSAINYTLLQQPYRPRPCSAIGAKTYTLVRARSSVSLTQAEAACPAKEMHLRDRARARQIAFVIVSSARYWTPRVGFGKDRKAHRYVRRILRTSSVSAYLASIYAKRPFSRKWCLSTTPSPQGCVILTKGGFSNSSVSWPTGDRNAQVAA